MRSAFDFTPYRRSTVGFDRLFSLLDQAVGVDQAPSYPPYNIERTGENAYRITVAVAGFTEDELAIEVKEQSLSIRGAKQAEEGSQRDVLYRGIAARSFERRFQLADYVVVTDANLADGLLAISLKREIPEALKPRRIEIGTGQSPLIEGEKAA